MGWGGAGRERAPSWGGLPSRGGRPATGKSIDSGGITSGRRREAAGRERTQEPSGQQLEPRELRGRDRTQGLYGQQLEPRELRGRDRTQEPSGQQLEPRELRDRDRTQGPQEQLLESAAKSRGRVTGASGAPGTMLRRM